MTDLVATVPQKLWEAWLAEGDRAGTPFTGNEYGWITGRRVGHEKHPKPPIDVGERLYIVARGLLRGYAPVTSVGMADGRWVIFRRGGAVAVTLYSPIEGFQGWRKRWWGRQYEIPFPEWETAVGPKGKPRRR